MIIQLIGLPGSGKTTIAEELSSRINGVHLNADDVRATVNSDLGFSIEDRIENARRLGEMARLLERRQEKPVIVDFVCPTAQTREVFGKPDILIWMNTLEQGRFEDTNKMWETPTEYDHVVENTGNEDVDSVEARVLAIINKFKLHDWRRPTTLMLGRYQPWHEGHHALYQEAGKRTDQVVLGVRDTYKTSEKDPLTFTQVNGYISADPAMDSAMVIKMPNITNIVYGRDVGYKIEEVVLDAATQAISATQKRKEMGI